MQKPNNFATIALIVFALFKYAIDCAAQEGDPMADEYRARKIVEDADQIRFPKRVFRSM